MPELTKKEKDAYGILDLIYEFDRASSMAGGWSPPTLKRFNQVLRDFRLAHDVHFSHYVSMRFSKDKTTIQALKCRIDDVKNEVQDMLRNAIINIGDL